MVVISST